MIHDGQERELPCRTCNVAERAPEYSGTCKPAIPYTVVGSSTTAPYACEVSNVTTTAAAAAALGAALAGEECAAEVDRQLDCDALCVCAASVPNSMGVTTGCSDPVAAQAVAGPMFCHCPACDEVPPVADDPSYTTVTSLNATSTGMAATSSRRLQQVQPSSQIVYCVHFAWAAASESLVRKVSAYALTRPNP